MKCVASGKIEIYSSKWNELYLKLRRRWINASEEEDKDNDFLFSTIYRRYQKYHTYSEIIFLFKSLLYFKESFYGIEELHMFFQYLRCKNQYFSAMVQSNQIQGLTNFRKFYHRMLNESQREISEKLRYELIFKSLAQNLFLKKLEIRVCPDIPAASDDNCKRFFESEERKKEIKRKLLESMKLVLEAYQNNMLEVAGISKWSDKEAEKIDTMYREGKAAFPTIGIVYHFIKNDYLDNRIGDTCWITEAEEVKEGSKHLRVWRYWMVQCAQILEELRSEIPLLADYFVGIDAASEENKTEPWVFAPVYAAIRNKKITKPVLYQEKNKIVRINNLGFTYHVGEEFRHLLSGLRHVDEVIEHFRYKAGDRVGHAIALGVDADYWIKKNEVVIIPIMEHLENLLWLWGKLVYKDWGIELNIEAVEGKILNLAKRIYGEINGLTVHMLYDAYIAKFHLNYEKYFDKMREYIQNEPTEVNCKEKGLNHFCKFYNIASPYGIMWTVEKVFCTYFCPLFYQRFSSPILVRVSNEEHDMFKKIQEKMIKEIEEKGIYVEANPTSNLAIGEVQNFHSSHLLNLNSKDLCSEREAEHEVLITINSDNPIVFNTSSENELAYMYHALTYHGYNKESVLRWTDKVRQMGLDSSFVKKEKKPSQQLMEITRLIEKIDQKCKGIGYMEEK